MVTFGQRLKELRIEKELNQPELAKILNVAKQTVSNWENDNRFPDRHTLIIMADFFNVSVDYLIGRAETKTGLIVEDKINNDDIKIEVNKNIYPNGLTHEEVLNVLERLKDLNIDWEKFKNK